MSNLMPYRFGRSPIARADFPFMNDFFEPFFGSMSTEMRVDVKDEGDHYLLEADLPGFKKGDVNIEIDDGVLTVMAETNEEKKDERKANYVYNERRQMKLQRSFRLNGIDETAVSAAFEDGVLKLTMPKLNEQVQGGRKIDIQ